MSLFSWPKVILILATTVVLGACGAPLSETPVCELQEINLSENQSDQLNISVYVDGSGSMLGYVKPSNSAYIRALNSLGDRLELAKGLHKTNNLNYYRIGTGTTHQNITRSDYRKAQLPVFYDGTDRKNFPAVASPIHEAVRDPSPEDDLLVIITDLEQDQGDVTKLTKNLKDRYFNENKNYAVGLWAVKSEFDGRVYIENEQKKLEYVDYNTNNKTINEYRPFYILMVGRTEDIEYYFDELSRNSPELTNGEQGHLLIFNPHHLVGELASLKTLPNLPEGLDNPVSLSDSLIQINQDLNNPYQLLRITAPDDANHTVNLTMPLDNLKYSLPFDVTSLTVNNTVKIYEPKPDAKFVEETQTPSLKQAIEVSNWRINNQNELEFSTTIKPEQIDSNIVYLYDLEILATRLETPQWWGEWSWQSLAEQDGSKTQNLERFLTQLKDISFDSMTGSDRHIPIGKLCFGLNK